MAKVTWGSVVIFAGVAILQGCSGSDEPAAEDSSLTVCVTGWQGELVEVDDLLAVRGCLREGLCTDELQLSLDWDAQRPPAGLPQDPNVRNVLGEYDGFVFNAGVIRTAEPGQESFTFSGSYKYGPELADSLTSEDRPTLTIQSGEGETLVQSASTVPYIVSMTSGDDDVETCKSLQLDLNGSPRP
jgi:hypothetical protein